ncbi:hypothetical protein [Spiroplasma endosymbiont of Panorpa germanica]|uniref:hypothetical protein n=1 Tax=Spiroplasma endosymbiont of Panorpa germanica TaxID=3066314 RepID=UPI0030D01BB3
MKKLLPIIGVLGLSAPTAINSVKPEVQTPRNYSTNNNLELKNFNGSLVLPVEIDVNETISSGWNDLNTNRGSRFVANLSQWANNITEFIQRFPTFSYIDQAAFGNVLGQDRFVHPANDQRFSTIDLLNNFRPTPTLDITERNGLAWQQIGARAMFELFDMNFSIGWDLWSGSQAAYSRPWIRYEIKDIWFYQAS